MIIENKTKSFIKKATKIHGNKYDYSKVVYEKSKIKIIIICKEKDHGEFLLTPEHHLNKSGCQKCSGKARLNNDINWQCLNCFYFWKTTFNNIKHNNNGCPKCAGNKPLTNNDIDQFLIDQNIQIKRKDNYKNICTKINWECLKCLYIWSATPNNIKADNRCPNCILINNIILTNANIDKFLLDYNRPIKRESKYIDFNDKIKWRCLKNKCGYIWFAKFNNIKNGTGCPLCAGKIKHSNDFIDNFLLKNNILIKRLGEYKNISNKIEWLCLNIECDNRWKTSFSCIKNSYSGCPECAPKSKGEKITRDLLKELNINSKKPPNIILPHNKLGRYTVPDFWLLDFNLLIEINGTQHYKPVTFGTKSIERAEAKFKWQKIRDQNLRTYCNQNKINLLEVDSRKYYGEKLKIFLKRYLALKIFFIF